MILFSAVRGMGQVAKLLVLSCGVRLTCASRSGKFGRIARAETSVRLEVTVKEQQEQRRVKHEKGEGEMTER